MPPGKSPGSASQEVRVDEWRGCDDHARMAITTALRRRSTFLATITALVILAGGPLANPQPTYAGTAANVEAEILRLVNNARANRGVPPLRTTASLMDFAGDRAAKMASTGILKHPACLPCKLDRRDIPYSTYGETIAWTYPWGFEAARKLFRIWKNSPPHWGILMSPRYDRIGIGVARRSNGSTWAAAVLTGQV
jgi:uncharacterized protein YkwD